LLGERSGSQGPPRIGLLDNPGASRYGISSEDAAGPR
jgi:hypothetical protein